MARSLFLGFDLETTSNVPATTRAVQAAAVAIEVDTGKVVFQLNELCKPGDVQIADSARAVHGISNEDVKDKPLDIEVLQEVMRFIKANKDDIVVAGHNSKTFDLPIMFRLTGETSLGVPDMDTLICATRCLPYAPSHKLSELIQHLKLGTGEGAHDALADIMMVYELAKKFSADLNMSYEELAEWCSIGRVLEICHFGKHKGKKWGRGQGCVPYFYAKFCAENFDTPSPDFVATLKHYYGLNCKGA